MLRREIISAQNRKSAENCSEFMIYTKVSIVIAKLLAVLCFGRLSNGKELAVRMIAMRVAEKFNFHKNNVVMQTEI